MNPVMLKDKLLKWTVANSGMEQRAYLGMSRISDCPRLLVRELRHGRRWNDNDALRCYAGYLWEADVKTRLEALDLYKRGSERELIAEFDSRYMGHTDGELRDRSLLEIKSTTTEKLERIRRERRIPVPHYRQVQTYMRHGHYEQAMVIYVSRESGELYTHTVLPDWSVMDWCDTRARSILADFDEGITPSCTCGWCR